MKKHPWAYRFLDSGGLFLSTVQTCQRSTLTGFFVRSKPRQILSQDTQPVDTNAKVLQHRVVCIENERSDLMFLDNSVNFSIIENS